MKTEIINYDIDGKDFLGYAAFPDADNFPAVIIAVSYTHLTLPTTLVV